MPFFTCELARGCKCEDTGLDIFTDALCVVNSVVHSHSNGPLNNQLPAFTVSYTGPAATATISRLSGTNAGVYVVNIGGTEHTFDTGSYEGTGSWEAYWPGSPNFPPAYRGADGVGGYWFSDLVAWLNSLPNVTATLLLDENDPFEKRMAATGVLAGGLPSSSFTANIKNTTLTVYAKFDKHNDVYQQIGGIAENIIFAFNFVKYAEAQLLFIAPSVGSQKGQRDVFFVANALVGDGGVLLSQLGTNMTASHLVIAHNTLPNQAFMIRGNVSTYAVCDSYTMFKNNVFKAMSIENNGTISNLTIDGLRVHAGGSAPPGSTNVNIGGNQNTLFVNFAARDLRPAGELAQVGRPSALPYDIQGAAYPANAALGAYAKGV
jgi:hypothetical protein